MPSSAIWWLQGTVQERDERTIAIPTSARRSRNSPLLQLYIVRPVKDVLVRPFVTAYVQPLHATPTPPGKRWFCWPLSSLLTETLSSFRSPLECYLPGEVVLSTLPAIALLNLYVFVDWSLALKSSPLNSIPMLSLWPAMPLGGLIPLMITPGGGYLPYPPYMSVDNIL